ncbi:MAG: hypothetical protein H3C34_24625, partial [Caldilineaceae bacterium]|nr:hypothetical protein [Caldilineaceae bacterium]
MKRLTFVILAVGLLVALPTAAVLSSTNGAWIKYTGNPVLRANPANAWDDFNVYSSHVLWDGSQFRMWYSGTSFTQNEKDIGYATSADGLTWTKHPGNPVLSVGPFGYWDHERINAPTVLYDATDKLWKMWYAGVSIYNGGFSIGYATSPDGINWTKYSDEPIFESSGHPDYWDGISVLAPEVLKKDGKYHMW